MCRIFSYALPFALVIYQESSVLSYAIESSYAFERINSFDYGSLWTIQDVEQYLCIPDNCNDSSLVIAVDRLEECIKAAIENGLLNSGTNPVIQPFSRIGNYGFSFVVPSTQDDIIIEIFDYREWRNQRESLLKYATMSHADWRSIPEDFKVFTQCLFYKILKTKIFLHEWFFSEKGGYVLHARSCHKIKDNEKGFLISHEIDRIIDALTNELAYNVQCEIPSKLDK